MASFYGMLMQSMACLTALSALAAQQANATTEILKCIKQLLEYCTSQEPAVLT